VVYGDNLKTFTVIMNNLCNVGYNKISDLLSHFTHDQINISEGTLKSIVKNFSKKLNDKFIPELRDKILHSTVLGADETGSNDRNWVHVISNKYLSFLHPHRKRNLKAVEDINLLNQLTHYTTVITDSWSMYNHESLKYIHALCNAHILRELFYFTHYDEKYKTNKFLICEELSNILKQMCGLKNQYLEIGGENEEYYVDEVNQLIIQFNNIVERRLKELGKPKTKTKDRKLYCLLTRLFKRQDDVFRFSSNLLVPFTNNLAETTVRGLKTKLKVINSFRTFSGLSDYCTIKSFIDTAKKHDLSAFSTIKNTYSDEWFELKTI